MQDTQTVIDENPIIQTIQLALNTRNYDFAAELLMKLNIIRKKQGLEEYTIRDILFICFKSIFPEFGNGKNEKSVYIALFEDGTTKIGVSKDPETRIKNLSFQKGSKPRRYCYSIPIKEAYQIEGTLHKRFKDHQIRGEYFNIDYDDARAELDNLTKSNGNALIAELRNYMKPFLGA